MDWKNFNLDLKAVYDSQRHRLKLKLATHQRLMRYRYTFQGAILNAYQQHRNDRSWSQL